jgi:CBS domain containing-hemolysin-like protein
MVEYQVLYIILTLIFSAFFSWVEIAFVTSNKLRLEIDKKKGSSGSNIISMLIKNPAQFITCMLLGKNIALVIYCILMGMQLDTFFTYYVTNSESGILVIQIIVSTLIFLITGEFIPKALFMVNSNRVLNFLAIPVFLFYILLYPLAWIIRYLSNVILKTFFRTKVKSNVKNVVFGSIDLENIIALGKNETEKESEIEHDVKLFQNALDFSKVKLRECTIPRNEIAAMELDSPVSKLKEKFIETGYSKILIYKDTIDNIIGYTQSSDLFKNPGNISQMLRSIIISPETMSANKLLNLFMKEQKSIALIVDEFGGTSGIVTIEDIMEEIFGEIEDEHDSSDFKEEKIAENEYLFSGRLEIDYINEKFDLTIPESEDYETIAGFILHHHEEIPNENDRIIIGLYEFEILKMQNPKIELIKLKIKIK